MPRHTNILKYESYILISNQQRLKMLDRIALTILIIGGLNWGSIGLFNFDIVSWIFSGSAYVIARIIFALVGLCALWCVYILFKRSEHLSAAE